MCVFEQQILNQYEPLQGTRRELTPAAAGAEDLLLGACEVHEALCAPTSQRIRNYDIACAMQAARRVSGDFTATFEHDDSWFLALGDLMGKGLPAAMWLTHVLDLLRRSCETGQSFSGIMQSLNREMYHSRVGVPLTSLFLARLGPTASSVTYCCAGCPPAFLLTGGETVTMLESGGPILGAVAYAKYSSATIELGLHDTLLAATDGIIEMHQGINFDLRPDRVANHLRFTAGESAISIVQSLIARVRAASTTISDDLSLMAVQRVA